MPSISENSKKQIKSYGKIGAVAILSASAILFGLYLTIFFILIYENAITNWIKNYLNFLLKENPNNSFLKLFAKNIDQILNREYLLSYSKSIFYGFGTGIAILALLIFFILSVSYRSLKTQGKSVREEISTHKVASFAAAFSLSTIIVSLSAFIAVYKLLSNDTAKMMTNYLDKVIPTQGNNPFLEVFKGIINASFKPGMDNDLIIGVRNKFSIFSYVIFSLSIFVFVLSISYLLCNNTGVKESQADGLGNENKISVT
ncbi:MAG: hypothetical protein HRK26_02675 [Rickettsiaceae bacterium H1]|nr:hypothetical protein [Rickettsiaceae bacterium H1]